eukprot:500384_1
MNERKQCTKRNTAKRLESFCNVRACKFNYYANNKSNQYTIRSFKNKDINKLQQLDVEMTLNLLGNDEEPYGDYLDLITNVSRTRFQNWRTISCATMNDDKAIGFIIYKLYKYKRTKYIELFWLGVDVEHRKRGIGKRLIQTMIEESNKEWAIKQFKLNVLSNNRKAMKFYENIGFVRKERKNNYPVFGCTSFRYSLTI